ncbi:hypothetical protein RSOLAG1IB_08201 [Rhizoctonia solani AG-1 IB]|uniref:Uncharacterized protein n=1 Tax=Thanatephorus cucumeris (strain AG1-IB / isolate 7/3/14) TaxID=1108050 RepID=A0A0B7FL04_THACB|nr:hypothetical protein RSOLAG1IB_08201 [Rhizoctonia solani AG-1 IB]
MRGCRLDFCSIVFSRFLYAVESLQPAANTQLLVPGPDLNILLQDLYHLRDCDAGPYSDALLIAAARATWYAIVYGHKNILIVLRSRTSTR